MASVTSSTGGDPTKAIVGAVRKEKKQLTRDAVDLWFQESFNWLTEAAERRSELGRAHGHEGRSSNGLHQIAQSFMPPKWDSSRGAWIWSVPHYGAVFQEFGAIPHEIRAKKAETLAFEWPDQPEAVREQFEHTEGDLVFFESINHPGIPAIGFVRYGRDKAKRELEYAGYSADYFKEGDAT